MLARPRPPWSRVLLFLLPLPSRYLVTGLGRWIVLDLGTGPVPTCGFRRVPWDPRVVGIWDFE